MNLRRNEQEIIILRHNGGQLGNQLLLYTSIFAYCLEKDYKCTNYSFYEYNKYFQFKNRNFWIRIFEKLSEVKFNKSRVIVYFIYKYTSYLLQTFKKGLLVKADPMNTFYLPPTPTGIIEHQRMIRRVENSSDKLIYIDGWSFRNPVGLRKYRKQIIKFFLPKEEIIKKAREFIEPLKERFSLIGVHIRQGEYKNKKFMRGEWYFNEEEVADILKSYLKKEAKNPEKILFILCSDGPLDISYFTDLKIQIGIGKLMEDLITLSMCDTIIGSNSTFGSFAAYIGDIPFFIFDRKKKFIRAKGENLMQG